MHSRENEVPGKVTHDNPSGGRVNHWVPEPRVPLEYRHPGDLLAKHPPHGSPRVVPLPLHPNSQN